MSVVHPVYTSDDFLASKNTIWTSVLDNAVTNVRAAMERGQSSRQVRIQNPPQPIYVPLVRTFFTNNSNLTGFDFVFERLDAEALLISWTVSE